MARPVLAMQYSARFGPTMRAFADEIVTIERGGSPSERVSPSIRFATAWVRKNVPRRLTARISSKLSGCTSNRSPRTLTWIPALLTRQSTVPKAANASPTSRAWPARSATEPGTNAARRPLARSVASVSRVAASSTTSFTTTSKPTSASAHAIPRPMPRRAPVTNPIGARVGISAEAPQQRRAEPIRRGGRVTHAHAGRMMDRVEDRRRGRDQRRLADPLGAVRAERLAVLDQDHLDRRDVAERRDQVIVEVLGLAGVILLHQREADALGDPAMDLAFHLRRVDRPADVVRGGDLQELGRTELEIHRELGELRGEPVGRVGRAPAVRVERHGRRAEIAL